MLYVAFGHSSPPQPPKAAHAKIPAAPPGRGPVLPASVPVHLDIPRIGVHTRLLSLGLAPDHSADVPSLDQAHLASWYNLGPTPGQLGPAVLLGHVDTKSGPAVFYSIGSLHKGDMIHVTRTDGTIVDFTVDGTTRVPKAHFPTQQVFGDLDFAGIRLITCGGEFDTRTHHYLDNTIVFGHLTDSHR